MRAQQPERFREKSFKKRVRDTFDPYSSFNRKTSGMRADDLESSEWRITHSANRKRVQAQSDTLGLSETGYDGKRNGRPGDEEHENSEDVDVEMRM